MKAELESIPTKDVSNTLDKLPAQGGDNLWASVRRLKAQVAAIEAALNIVRTMAMRTERKLYRDTKDNPPSDENVKEVATGGFPPAFFGEN